MKAYEVAKKLYPLLSKEDFIEQTCPDILNITEHKPKCCENNRNQSICENCVACWEQEVSDERFKWLIEARKICNVLGC
jgi:hypothetical protein